jgi:hypothetical protein
MPATPILEDLDMNFSEIIKERLENVASLPTGLNSSHKGYSVYFNSKVWIWDGTQWCTWDSLPWTYEDNDAVDHLIPRNETTPFNATSHFLNNTSWNINLSEGYDDNIPRTLGTMHFVGCDDTISEWQQIKGRRFVYTAKDGSWFNIKNNSQDPMPANHKRIDTRTDTDLFDVVKAEFSYSYTGDVWILVSFERRQNNWFKRYEIPGTPVDTISVKSGQIPSSPSEGLPFNGFYEVDVYVGVKEYRDTMVQMFTQQPQKLEVSAPGDIWRVIDLSGHYNQGVAPAPTNEWYNNSLQGSAIVYVNNVDCGTRDFWYRVTLPNGSFKQLLGGYMHARYLGTTEGNNCNQ